MIKGIPYRVFTFATPLIFLLLSACSPNEADFKSAVPVKQSPTEAVLSLPDAINLEIPFFPQAPDGDWSLPWQETCEEASVILAYYAATHKSLTKDEFRQEILNLVEWENKTFGDYKHTNIAQTAQILKEYYAFSEFEIVENPAVDQLKNHLAQGHLIIAPFAGRELPNPFYRQPGPLYHMMVLRGYDDKNFIVNDVGTKRGENFIYPYQTLLSAMHEWHDEDIQLGAKKVIILSPET